MIANLQGKIITFYSYKGGVGRSMILANTAWILASHGKKVLVIDWDLEAPGLDRYFHPFLSEEELMDTPGLINFLTDFLEAAFTPAEEEDEDENWHEPFTDIQNYLISLNYEFPKAGKIDLLASGQQGNRYYAAQVNAFNWDRFYDIGGGRFLEAVKEKMRTNYDYILIDSRTGISDTAGICTVQMPDSLVILFSGNDQSILGAARVAHSVNQQWQTHKKKPNDNQLVIFPVLARTDRTEKDKLDLARQIVKSQFSHILQSLSPTEQEAYWGNVEMPYIPWYAYEEVLATFRDNPYERASLLSAIEQLVAYITYQEITKLVIPSDAERQKILSLFSRQSSPKKEVIFLSYHSDDHEIIHKIATYLKSHQLNVWFEQWQVKLGESWELQRKVGQKNASTFAIFIGKQGLSHIQQRDVELALHYQTQNHDIKIIPIFLLEAKINELPPTLLERKPLKFQKALDQTALSQLERILKGLPDNHSESERVEITGSHLTQDTKHDIFVSYAHVDNEPLPGADKGWVTTLINGLKNLLGQKLGRRDAYSLWMDDESRGDESATPEIIHQLEHSIILLVILSPAYLESTWCRSELETFLANICEESDCLFIIERSEIERPKPINHLMGYKFWIKNDKGRSRTLAIPKPSSQEIEYYQKLDDIACDLSDNIKKLRHKDNEHKKATQPIFLALVSDDLEEQRHEVKRYLEQQNIPVLPNKAYSFAHIQEFIEQDLKQCRLFVQLLSDKSSYHIPQFQYERAKALKLPILQWCDKKLTVNHLYDEEHKQLLSQSTVIASSLEDFKKYIIKQLTRKEIIKNNQPQNLPSDPLVFINAIPEDMALAYQIGHILLAQGIAYSLPLEISDQLSAKDIQNYLEKNLRECDAIILIYQNAPAIWVNEQIRYCWKIQGLREHPFKSIVIYNTHANNELMLSMRLPNLLILECPTPQTDNCLPQLIQKLNNITN